MEFKCVGVRVCMLGWGGGKLLQLALFLKHYVGFLILTLELSFWSCLHVASVLFFVLKGEVMLKETHPAVLGRLLFKTLNESK